MGFLDNIWDSTTIGRRQQATQSQRLADEFKMYIATDNPEEKAKILAGIQQNPQFAKLQERMSTVQKPTSVLSPKEEAANAGYKQLSPEEQKSLVLNPRGYSRGATDNPLVEGAVNIGKIQSARDKFDDIPSETAAFFDVAEKSVKERVGFDKYLAEEGRKEKAKYQKILEDTTNKINSVIPKDNRGVFSEGTNPFEETTKPAATKPTTKAPGVKEMSEYLQTGTETVPEDTKPKTFAEIGITETADQQQFQTLEKKMPDMDLRAAYSSDPATFQAILKALRLGKAPNGKPFTIKEAIALIQASQQ